MVDFVSLWSKKTDIDTVIFVRHLGISKGKYFDWKKRYGTVNRHNAKTPRNFWIEDHERAAVLSFQEKYPLEGYRRLSFMMTDQNVAFVSPTTVYRILHAAGRLDRLPYTVSKKGTGFHQPTRPHQHWHIDVTYINISGTFYYLCTILDGYSRSILHWGIDEKMCEEDIEIILERAREKYPSSKPCIISDNGPQFIAKDFKDYVRLCGMTHVRTSPYYPQSNGKIEAWHKTLKTTTIRPKAPTTLEEARLMIGKFIEHYNTARLHSAIGYITPNDKLHGKADEIFATRTAKIEAARASRVEHRKLSQLVQASILVEEIGVFINAA